MADVAGTARWCVAAVVAVALAVVLGGCGGSGKPRVSAPPAGGGLAAAQGVGPPGGSVPAGFDPDWVSAISAERWWLLGQRPCSPKACLSILRTSDGGRHFVAIPAPLVHYELAGCPYAPVSQLTFADERNGFAYGCALYVTHDGGGHWRRLELGGFVIELATANGSSYAVVSDAAGNRLMRSGVGGDDWVALPAAGDVDEGLTAHRSDVLVQSASGALLISHDDGKSFTHSNSLGGPPCSIQEVTPPVLWAFCSGGTLGSVMRSTDEGQIFRFAEGGSQGAGASGEYHGAVFAAVNSTTAVVGFQQLLRTSNAGRSYTPVGPSGLQWEYLGFIDTRHAIALAAPPSSVPVGAHVYYTSDGGFTYRLVPIRSNTP